MYLVNNSLHKTQNTQHSFSDPIDFSLDPWPVVDDDGYYQSYQQSGRWINHWQKSKPGGATIAMGFLTSTDENGAAADENIDTNLPVVLPYWMESNNKEVAEANATAEEKKIQNAKAKHRQGGADGGKSKDIVKRGFGGDTGGIRATWIGHATVLAEIDEAVILCDPIFR